ncbi:MAG: cupin domain-containing protein, partial [Gemmatimonadales bacterium]|nr:cupin domain-containing protein [Gemmatimonadales bacterium]
MNQLRVETVPASLESLVSYQDAAIVSRILVKTAGGSLTLFAFDAGQSLSEHTVPHQAFVVIL